MYIYIVYIYIQSINLHQPSPIISTKHSPCQVTRWPLRRLVFTKLKLRLGLGQRRNGGKAQVLVEIKKDIHRKMMVNKCLIMV